MQKRYILMVLFAAAVALAVLVLVDVDFGLPLVSLAVWAAVIIASVVLVIRRPPARLRRRARPRTSTRRAGSRQLTNDRSQDVRRLTK